MDDVKIKLRDYISSNLVIKPKKKFSIKNIIEDKLCEESDVSFGACQKECSSIRDFIDKHDDYSDFQTMLFKFIDDRNLKDSDVYNKVHIDRRLFSKIRSDKNYHPSKETIILLAIALELSEKELDVLLESASYSLPKNNNYDLIIRFCFINKIFKLSDINELLYEYKCKLFNY